MSSTFWSAIDATLDRIEDEKPDTFNGVRTALSHPALAADVEAAGCSGVDAAFFAGSGGDRSLWGALKAAGWRITWIGEDFYYVAKHPVSGEVLTYCEGDVLRGDRSVQS